MRLATCEAPSSKHRPAQLPRSNGANEGRCRILVVDDFHDNADSLAILLQSMGHEVQISYGGEQAIEAAENFLPDIAFIDLGMPTVGGYEVCRHIRAQTWGTSMYLVAQTGWDQEFDRDVRKRRASISIW